MKNRLRQLREEQKLTQKELADKLKLSKPTISKYEDGSVDMSTETLVLCAEMFNCSIDYILYRTDNRNQEIIVPEGYLGILSSTKDISPDKLKKIIEFAKLSGLLDKE